MSNREKNLGLMVLVVAVLGITWTLVGQVNRQIREMTDQLAETEGRLNQTRTLLAGPANPNQKREQASIAIGVDDKDTMILLADLTRTQFSDGIRIVEVDRTSDKTYKVTLDGKFTHMMRFLSFLERKEGKFGVRNMEIARAPVAQVGLPGAPLSGAMPPKEVRAVLYVGVKG